MRRRPVARFRRLAVFLATSAMTALLLSSGTAAAATGTKISVCHFDKTLGQYVVLTVSTKSAHLPKGDFLADTRLAGKTVYALAYSDTDGVNGYSGCDALIGALVEDSGDSAVSAGDSVILGSFPTAFSAPYSAVSFGAGPLEVTSVEVCDGANVGVDVGGLVAGWQHQDNEGFGYGDVEDSSPIVYAFDSIVGGGAAVNFSDHLLIDYGSTQIVDGLGRIQDDPFVDVGVTPACAA